MRHQFTIKKKDGSVYVFADCWIDAGQGKRMFFLFKDGRLLKISDYIPREMEEAPYKGTTWRRVKSWDIEDMSYIEKNINAPALSYNEIRNQLNQKSANYGEEPANIMPAFFPYSIIMSFKAKKDYLINQKLRKKFNGFLARPGMSIEEIDALYGKPLKIFATNKNHVVHIYGQKIVLDINPQYKFSNIAVVFDNDGKVVKVFSHDFFNEKWLKH